MIKAKGGDSREDSAEAYATRRITDRPQKESACSENQQSNTTELKLKRKTGI
ncbi:hypothetical protein [Pseudobacillus wudalianchiensis]|uniref:hypothetical protein n=1 Tax=Pseudobacillus wudalianchiensis TaxID=1743143 RepID=UPI00159F32EC|nr:hypothetical protein [Bacillus wudalianchiensis]